MQEQRIQLMPRILIAPGVYTVWLYNNYSSCDSISQQVTVNPNPVANFTAPVRTKCEPSLTVNFQDLSTGGATGWAWDFGDGGTSTLQNPSYTYTTWKLYGETGSNKWFRMQGIR